MLEVIATVDDNKFYQLENEEGQLVQLHSRKVATSEEKLLKLKVYKMQKYLCERARKCHSYLVVKEMQWFCKYGFISNKRHYTNNKKCKLETS